MDVHLGICDCHDIDLSCLGLLLKEWSLSHTDANVHLRATHMVQGWFRFGALRSNKNVEVDIHVAATGFVLSVPVELGLLLLFQFGTSL